MARSTIANGLLCTDGVYPRSGGAHGDGDATKASIRGCQFGTVFVVGWDKTPLDDRRPMANGARWPMSPPLSESSSSSLLRWPTFALTSVGDSEQASDGRRG